ncbi:MAG: hypothetical protein JNM20_10190 [Rhizobiales bacterium]|nr:hypothetical protein [Hyphomicrobiales bacterium]
MGEQQLKNIEQPVRVYRSGAEKSKGPVAPAVHARHDKPCIAVLPFVNMSGNTENEFFADGLTEDIITALSRSITLSVIARTSSFAYKGKTANIKRIAAELDVGYVLEGSVRKVGNHVRVTAQLIEAGTGTHIWAEKYDGPATDILAIQDQITRSVATSTHTTIYSSATKTARTLEHFASPAYRLAVRANSCLFEMTPKSFERAAELAEEALTLDPDFSLAYRLRANVFIARLGTGLLPHSPENMERGVVMAREALRRAPDDEWCHWLMAFALAEAGRLDEAVAECDTGLEINPNASMILGDKGDYLVMLGRAGEAIPLCELALRLNPRDPICYWWENSIATAHFIEGRFQPALDLARRVALRKPDHVRAMIIWAASAGQLGHTEEAGEAVGRCLAMFVEMRVGSVMPHYIPLFRRVEDRQLLIDGLRRAGLPE